MLHLKKQQQQTTNTRKKSATHLKKITTSPLIVVGEISVQTRTELLQAIFKLKFKCSLDS